MISKKKYPITTRETGKYFDIDYTPKNKLKRLRRYLRKEGSSEDKLTRDPVYRFLIALIPSAEILLLWGMLFAFVIVLYLIINEIWYFGLRWV